MKLIWPNVFDHLVTSDQDAEQFVYYDESMRKSSASRIEFFSLATRFASILRASGVERGDVVLVALPVSMEAAVAFYGTILTGAAAVSSELLPDNPDLFLHIARQSTAKFIVMRTESFDHTWSEFKDKVGVPKPGTLSAVFSDPRLPTVRKAVLMQRCGDNDFLSYVKSHAGCYVNRDVNEGDLATMFLTSGTTGVPKLVMRSHRSLVLEAEQSVFPADVSPQGKARRFYHNSPWSWAVASSFDILSGYTRVQPDLWHKPKDAFRMYVNIIKTDGVRNMFLTPPELNGIQKLWDDPSTKVVDTLLVAGFPVTRQLCKSILTAAKMVVVRFGCSEMIPISCNVITKEEDFEDFDCGAMCPGTVVKTVGDDLKELPLGTPGRVLLKCDSMFHGYMGQPDKTTEAINEEGWYVTSDAGYIDDKNHLFIIGRYDYVIRHKGQQLYPSAIEAKIRQHPQVKEVVVVPVPHPQNHHNICAYVVREQGSTLTENDVIKTVADSAKKTDAAGVTSPQHVLLVDSIERNIRGKINRNELIENAVKIINSQKNKMSKAL